MIHELKEIINQAALNQQKGLKSVLATVVFLEGSSYRKPGVRMLISENLSSLGAVSGGCVEKEIIHRATTVFRDNKPKVITYDGRYKLGCEGVLYVLIEPFFVTNQFISAFSEANSKRESLQLTSYFKKENEVFGEFGTSVTFKNRQQFAFTKTVITKSDVALYNQVLQPAFKLIIIGGEHDAVKLCKTAATLGWEVEIITSIKDSKQLTDFPGANKVISESPEAIKFNNIDDNCALVLMNHSYVQDLKYVIELAKQQPKYIGILGAPSKRERLFNELLEYEPETTEAFLDSIYTPAGLHIGAQTPEEIGVSIIAEILAVIRAKEPFSLRKLEGKIHK